MLTLQNLEQVVGSIEDLKQAVAGLLSIPQRIACTHSHISILLHTWCECCKQRDKEEYSILISSPTDQNISILSLTCAKPHRSVHASIHVF